MIGVVVASSRRMLALRLLEATTTIDDFAAAGSHHYGEVLASSMHSLILSVSKAAEPIYNPRLDLTAVADRLFSLEV